MTRRIIHGIACLSLVAACGESSHTPAAPPTSPSSSRSRSASRPAAATLVSVAISGPSVVQPGTTTQFAATATFNDNTTSDVTTAAVWRASPASVFAVTTPGLVTAMAAGEGTVGLSYQTRGASLNVVSLPANTGILGGHVTQSGFPVPGAAIDVVGGPFAGKTATCDASGFYRLYGVAGTLQIRASKDGYVAVTKPVTVTAFATPRHDQVLDFEIMSVNQPPALAGSYRATLRASAVCSGKLPSDVMVRNYTATAAQDGVRLTVTLAGAVFGTNYRGAPVNSFVGRVQSDSIAFNMGTVGSYYYYYYYYYSTPAILERLAHPQIGPWGFSQNDYLAVTGTATASIAQSTLRAALVGNLSIQTPIGTGTNYKTVGSCFASDHQLILVRQ